MSDTGNANGATADTQAQLSALVQYIKDLSFENPNAPRSLGPQEKGPNITLQVNVNAKQISDTDFEVELKLDGSAGEEQNVLFRFELVYAGVFRIRNMPATQLHPVVMVECPRLLFPFARQIVADSVRNGGFPPLYIDPIDFLGLYRQRQQADQASLEGAASA